MLPARGTCGWCQTPGATKHCAACKVVKYCNSECQGKAWKDNHKVICKKFGKTTKRTVGNVKTYSRTVTNPQGMTGTLGGMPFRIISASPDNVVQVVDYTVSDETKLHTACREGKLKRVKRLLADASVDKNATKDNGVTPLFLACQEGHLKVVQRMLEAGADYDMQTSGGATSLFIAAQNQHLDVVATLLEAGASHVLAVVGHPNASPLMIAAEKGNLDLITLLLQHGADAKFIRSDGVTCAELAFCQLKVHQHLEAFQMLLQAGSKFPVAKYPNLKASFMAYL